MILKQLLHSEDEAVLTQYLHHPVEHERVLGAAQVQPEEPEQALEGEIVIKLDMLQDEVVPYLAPDEGGGLPVPQVDVLVPPGLDVAEPGLQDESEAGVQGPVVEQVFEEGVQVDVEVPEQAGFQGFLELLLAGVKAIEEVMGVLNEHSDKLDHVAGGDRAAS